MGCNYCSCYQSGVGDFRQMIDLEKIVVIGLGSLVIVNFVAALLLTLDWRRIAYRWGRVRKWYAVYWSQLDDAERAFWRWYGRAAWVTVLVAVSTL